MGPRHYLVGRCERWSPIGRSRCMAEDNANTSLKESGRYDWIPVAQERIL
jgi:hypothetical protein